MKMYIELMNKDDANYESIILTSDMFNNIKIKNQYLFLKMLDNEYEDIKLKKGFYNIIFNIKIGERIVGRVEICMTNVVNNEEIFYQSWYEEEYSMGIIAANIINENLYYKLKQYSRAAVITYFKLYNTEDRGKGHGSFVFSNIENIIKKIFKIDVIYLYASPLDLSDNAQLYKEFIESDTYNKQFLFDELYDIEKKNAINEYEKKVKGVDNFYYKNNMKYINNHVFMKII